MSNFEVKWEIRVQIEAESVEEAEKEFESLFNDQWYDVKDGRLTAEKN